MVRVAERAVPPVTPGVKITVTVQEEPAATVIPVQLFVASEKSLALVPVNTGAVLETVTGEAVGLFRVTVCDALDVPMFWALNVSDVGLTKTTADIPVPERVTVGEAPLVCMVAIPEFAPTSCGVNLTYTAQEPV
jgi:hypothetical protein